MAMAVELYSHIKQLADSEDLLNLAWTLDEKACLATDLDRLLKDLLATEIDHELDSINRYLVKDPYGEDIMAADLARLFGLTPGDFSTTCGAGVIALLAALAATLHPERVTIVGDVYPDFPYWLGVHRVDYRFVPAVTGIDEQVALIRATGSSWVFLERPSLLDDHFNHLEPFTLFCLALAQHNITVLVDESNANYRPPAYSAANALAAVDNLIVLRGFSKAYGMGGLRMACCLAATALTPRVRRSIPPLLVSSLSLLIGKSITALGDITGELRTRIAARKKSVRQLLTATGIDHVITASEGLPYLLIDDDQERTQAILANQGIQGKYHPSLPRDLTANKRLFRLSVPLRPDRYDLFCRKIAGARGTDSA